MKRIFQVLATLLFTVVILVCIGIFVAPKLGAQLDIVYGGSMEPAIKLGSVAVIQEVNPQHISVGDVITYRSSTGSNMVTTHRVLEVINGESLSFHTKGDANENADVYTVPAENVVGRVWMSVPYAGYFMDFIKKPLGFGLLIGLPALLVILMELRNIHRNARILHRKNVVKKHRSMKNKKLRQAVE